MKMLFVDPPEGWKYGFPAPAQNDYLQQLLDAGYPEDKIPFALKHSRYFTQEEPKMTRVEILAEASRLTGGERNKEYGEPKDNLSATALLWTAYLQCRFADNANPLLTAEDVAWLNVLQKISRSFHGVYKPDIYIDAAAYAAIAGEVRE
jgi:hypothetical protein